ncbi:MAG: EamA family transporter [Methylocystaceae bacterium]|nr:EamA family transporter [Methylocystaceae bacterium]
MNPRDLLQALLVVVVWGFNFVAIKLSVTEIPPLLLSTIRFALTAAILLPFFRLKRGQFQQVFYVGLVMGVGHFGMLMVGLSGADAATSALMIQLGVPFSSILAAVFLKDHLGWRRSLAMGLAFAGAALLAGEPKGASLPILAALLFSAFCWAWGNILIKRIESVPPLAIMGWMGLFASPVIGAMSYVLEDNHLMFIEHSSIQVWMMLAYTIGASSFLAYHIWYSLIKRLDLNQVVPFTLLVPVVGVTAGVVLLDETLTHYKVIGGLMTLLGVGVIQYRQAKKAS